MAFLDNSGDIILDAVLTDAGRKRLSLGDGSFVVSKFALGDDEIDYSLYNPLPASGSGYQDLRILKLPVLEAFTNNTSTLLSKLLTYADNSLDYLPVVRLNNDLAWTSSTAGGNGAPTGGYFLAVNQTTVNNVDADGQALQGYLKGAPADINQGLATIGFDQGLIVPTEPLGYLRDFNRELVETSYIIEVDNRLITLSDPQTFVSATPSFIDDDSVASYYVSLGTDNNFFAQQPNGMAGGSWSNNYEIVGQPPNETVVGSPIVPDRTTGGKIGSRIGMALVPSLRVQTGNELFTQMGGTVTPKAGGNTYNFIDTVVRVTGFTTGYRVDVPIRLLRTASS